MLSTAYLPPVEYWSILSRHSVCYIEQWEHYPKQTYRNRCRITGPNSIQQLCIPVDKQGKEKVFTRDVRISYQEPWQRIHWRSIGAAYNNAPYFLYYRDELEPFYTTSIPFLLDFNQSLLSLFMKWLTIDTKLHLTPQYYPPSAVNDYREKLHPKKDMGFQQKLYYQVFSERFGFIPGLSILDVLCNLGPGASDYIRDNGPSLYDECL